MIPTFNCFAAAIVAKEGDEYMIKPNLEYEKQCTGIGIKVI
jgi:hypothetical protein